MKILKIEEEAEGGEGKKGFGLLVAPVAPTSISGSRARRDSGLPLTRTSTTWRREGHKVGVPFTNETGQQSYQFSYQCDTPTNFYPEVVLAIEPACVLLLHGKLSYTASVTHRSFSSAVLQRLFICFVFTCNHPHETDKR